MTPDELFQLIAANAQATAENTCSIAELRTAQSQNTRDIAELRSSIADLRAVVSDVREIQAEDSRRFNETFAFMQLQLVRMGQLYEQNADLQQRVAILENE